MADEKTQPKTEVKTEAQQSHPLGKKVELEREYIVPLKEKILVAVEYKRARKAVKVLKEFIAKHMHVANRDTRLVKLDKYLNQELWYRGIKNPISKVKVKAKKIAGVVYVELAELPAYVKFQKQKDENRANRVVKTNLKHDAEHDHVESNNQEDKKDEVEKEKAVIEAGLKENKAEAKAKKHTTNASHEKNTTPHRQVLQR
ncbi:50S ribosomal protein L31e [uncultured archaeon]|nr:50S ribosomal protein L31e [uncultured archaeon]